MPLPGSWETGNGSANHSFIQLWAETLAFPTSWKDLRPVKGFINFLFFSKPEKYAGKRKEMKGFIPPVRYPAWEN